MFANLLMLTGPLFMLQVYDRVLTSRSKATLVVLVVIVAFLFVMKGARSAMHGAGFRLVPAHALKRGSIRAC